MPGRVIEKNAIEVQKIGILFDRGDHGRFWKEMLSEVDLGK